MAKKNSIVDDEDHVVRPGPELEISLSSLTAGLPGRLDFNLDDYAGLGLTYRGKEIADLDRVVEQIDSGRAQDVSDGVITYAFFDHVTSVGLNNNPSFGEGPGYVPFSEAQKDTARTSVELWDDLVDVEFVEVEPGPGASSWGKNEADIWLANTSTGPAQAWAYFPGYTQQYERVSGDVWIADPEDNGSNNWLGFNGYGATTLIHELGHAIGLSHPGAYNGAGATNYDNQAEYAQDSEQYSIMSYWAPAETGANVLNWGLLFYGNAQTPMLHDVYVIQQKYGVDTTTRTDDTVYGFESTADRDVFDFSLNEYPNVTIWDAGGEDTLNFSGFYGGTVINLNDGQFSSGGAGAPSAAEVNANRAELLVETGITSGTVTDASVAATLVSFQNNAAGKIGGDFGWDGVLATEYNNISIAYGADIENAVGSDYRDIIVSNELDNEMTGNAGSDVFVFQDGHNYVTEAFENGGEDTILDFEVGVDIVDLSYLGIDGGSQLTITDNYLGIDIDGDGTIDQGITFANLAAVPEPDIHF
jgi:serralysin